MLADLIHHAKILIVDDELANVRLLEKILVREGYQNVTMTTDSRHAVPMFADDPPDLVLLDLHMPHLTGYEVLESLARLSGSDAFIPIIVLTADVTPTAKRLALAGGAHDFITKPFDNLEVALRIKNVLRTRFLHRVLENEKHILEERVQERTEALQTTIVDLRSAQNQIVEHERLRALGTMAASVVHDFNNILSLISGYTELLLKENDSSGEETKTDKFLRTILTAAKDGAQMVKHLAQFQRPPSPNDLRQGIFLARLVDQAIQSTKPLWENSGAEINVAAELDNSEIQGDPEEICELLTCLIRNAVEAMPAGGTLTLRTRTENDSVVLEIEDTGTGMTEEIRQRCLEPFFTTKELEGSGLGLAMVYGIVQRHRGSLAITTQVGLGTNFTVRLPNQSPANLDEPVCAGEIIVPGALALNN